MKRRTLIAFASEPLHYVSVLDDEGEGEDPERESRAFQTGEDPSVVLGAPEEHRSYRVS